MYSKSMIRYFKISGIVHPEMTCVKLALLHFKGPKKLLPQDMLHKGHEFDAQHENCLELIPPSQ